MFGIRNRIWQRVKKVIGEGQSSRLWTTLDEYSCHYHLLYENANNHNALSNGEAEVLRRLASIGELNVALDVGANVGDYTSLLYNLNSECRVYSFEPQPEVYKRLLKRFAGNLNNINLYNYGLSDRAESAELAIPYQSTGKGSLLKEKQLAIGRECYDLTIRLKVGDDFLQKQQIESTISIVKVDVEGWESRVIKGFVNSLERINVIQFEYTKAALFSRYFLHDYYRDYGKYFHIGKIYPKGVRFMPEYDASKSIDSLLDSNYIMVNKDRKDNIIEVLSL